MDMEPYCDGHSFRQWHAMRASVIVCLHVRLLSQQSAVSVHSLIAFKAMHDG